MIIHFASECKIDFGTLLAQNFHHYTMRQNTYMISSNNELLIFKTGVGHILYFSIVITP